MRQNGFTLMELLIAIAIMIIISGVGLTSFVFSLQKSRDAQRKSDVALIAKGIHQYANDFDVYPADDGNGNILGCYVGGLANQKCSWGSSWTVQIGGETITYMSKIPFEPNGNYTYYYKRNGTTGFSVFSILENVNDINYKTDAGSATYGAGSIMCGSNTLCNYEYTEGGVQ